MNPPDRKGTIESEILGREARLRELGLVTGELLHDLGGTLAVLNGRIALARQEAALGRIPTEELNRIGADAEELRLMVFEILAEMRGIRPSVEATFPVGATLDGVVHRWLLGAPSVTASLRSHVPADALISGQKSFFVRAIGNLLRNAARHARAEIRISASLTTDRGGVDIAVEDDGEGVPKELHDFVFDPFITGTSLGTGLGLSFARWGVERLGGRLTLDRAASGLGGATFRVRLPLSTLGRRSRPSTPPVAAPAADSPAPSLAGLRITLVDDDESVRTTFVRLLHRAGATATGIDPLSWTSLLHGVEQLSASAPDVVLLDFELRQYRGPDLTRALRDREPQLLKRVLYFSGGPIPVEPMDRPVLGKLDPWEEVVARILELAALQGEGD